VQFVGFKNYMKFIDDLYFWRSLLISLLLTGATLIIENGIGLLLATLVYFLWSKKSHGIYNALIFAPVVIPPIYVGILWSWFAHPDLGLVNIFIQPLFGKRLSLLGDPVTALLTVIIANNWKWIGFAFSIYLAALQEMPVSMYEAAQLDGANRLRIFFYIILPALKRTFLILMVLITAGAFQTFDLVFSMTAGGPGRSTAVLPLYIYEMAFFYYDFGYASAMSVIMFLITIGLSLIYFRFIKLK